MIGTGIGATLEALLGLTICDELAIGAGIGLVFGVTFGIFSSSKNNEE